LPFCHLQIKALRQPYPDNWIPFQRFPDTTNTIGDHVRKHRIRLHLLQSELAKRLGVHRVSIQNWERNIYQPATEVMPKIIEWLGYKPTAKPATHR
jgi:DNA-binding XRE family transcriptional regulator